MSPLRKVAIFTKRVILDEIFIFRDSLMPEYQLIDENENIAERDFFWFEDFSEWTQVYSRIFKSVKTRITNLFFKYGTGQPHLKW